MIEVNPEIEIITHDMALYDSQYLQDMRATNGSAGIDLRVTSNIYLMPGDTEIIPLGISVSIKNPYIVGLLVGRSGLASQHGIVVLNGVGVIDSDYQGELRVVLKNVSNTNYLIQRRDRVAQLIFSPIFLPQFKVVTKFQNNTVRGIGGFGSTGVK